jgi:hypothetical protein
MKKFLLSFVLFAIVGFASKVGAQCTVNKVSISNISTTTKGDSCETTFNLSFDLDKNNGNKMASIYLYTGATLSTFDFYGNNGTKAPTAAEIDAQNSSTTNANILGVIQVNTNTPGTKTATTFLNGQNTVGSPNRFLPGLEYTVTPSPDFPNSDRFTFIGIKLTVKDCSQAVTIKADVGATQVTQFNNFSCKPFTGSFLANAPILNGVLLCNNPRAFTFNVRVPNAATVTFTAYNANNLTTPLTSPSGTPLQNISVQAVGGNVLNIYGPYEFESAKLSKFDVYLDIKVSNVPNNNSLTITNTCAPLPVTLKSFEARRTSKEKVALNWITSSESNNSGFDVQRKDGNGEWKTVSFVMSQARNGNSDNNLSYQYIDNNSTSGISQYRLRQVDIDRRATLSEVRSVRGEEMAGNKVNVFPNPSQDGKVNLLFEDKNTSRNITVSDMTGRIIKQYRAIRDNSLTIEGLENGMYNIHITDMSTSATNVEKVIIKKR